MSKEIIESRELREENIGKVEVLEKVKAVQYLTKDFICSVEQAAEYYEVDKNTLKQTIKRNKNEFILDGYKVLKGEELKKFREACKVQGVPSKKTTQFAIIPRRALLRIGMLLTESNIAEQVRDYLLDTEDILNEVKEKAKKNGKVTNEEIKEIQQRKSKFFNDNIYDKKSVKSYLLNAEWYQLEDRINEVYNILKPCCTSAKYEIFKGAEKVLNKLIEENEFVKEIKAEFIFKSCSKGLIKLQSLHIDKINNNNSYNKNKLITIAPPIPSYYLIPDTPVFSFNKMYEYSKGITHRTKEYNNYIMNFPHMLVKDRFNDVDLNKPVELFIKIVAPQANDVDNAIKSLQDQIALALGGTDNNINDLHCSRKGTCDTIQESKVYVLLRNK